MDIKIVERPKNFSQRLGKKLVFLYYQLAALQLVQRKIARKITLSTSKLRRFYRYKFSANEPAAINCSKHSERKGAFVYEIATEENCRNASESRYQHMLQPVASIVIHTLRLDQWNEVFASSTWPTLKRSCDRCACSMPAGFHFDGTGTKGLPPIERKLELNRPSLNRVKLNLWS